MTKKISPGKNLTDISYPKVLLGLGLVQTRPVLSSTPSGRRPGVWQTPACCWTCTRTPSGGTWTPHSRRTWPGPRNWRSASTPHANDGWHGCVLSCHTFYTGVSWISCLQNKTSQIIDRYSYQQTTTTILLKYFYLGTKIPSILVVTYLSLKIFVSDWLHTSHC